MFKSFSKVLGFFLALYSFLIAIALMGGAFKLLGNDVAQTLITTTANPFTGLIIGILSTSIIQSSSVTTSIVVGMVSGGVLTIGNAVPIIMGANIGTSVTNTIVSLGHISRNDEFERAYAGATVHDLFNILSVAILLPLELMTGFMANAADKLSSFFYGAESTTFHSPIKLITKPVSNFISNFFEGIVPQSPKTVGVILIIVSAILIFFALMGMTKAMKSAMATNLERFFDKILGKSAFITITLGVLITAIIQSSSITTSMLIPLLGAGIITLEHVFPLTLGANIGTTITAILASLTGTQAGLTIAFVHLLFNISGTLIFYPIPALRKIPLTLAKKLAYVCVRNKKIAFIYIASVFFIIPIIALFISKLVTGN